MKKSPWLALAVLLAVAYGLDRWLEAARGITGAGMGVSAFQWLIVAANLAFATAALWLAWLLYTGRARHRGLAALCVALGLAICLLPTPPFWAPAMRLSGLLVPLLRASPFSVFGHAGAFLIVMGLTALLAPVRSPTPQLVPGTMPENEPEIEPGSLG